MPDNDDGAFLDVLVGTDLNPDDFPRFCLAIHVGGVDHAAGEISCRDNQLIEVLRGRGMRRIVVKPQTRVEP